MNPNMLKHVSWLMGVALFLVFMSCRDFDDALNQCVQTGMCSADGGPQGDGGPDGGPVVDPFEGEPPGTCSLDAGLCLRSTKELLHNQSGSPNLLGLWGSRPDDVFLATNDGQQMLRFDGGFTTIDRVDYLNVNPARLHGTDSTNVWAISQNFGFCSGMPLLPPVPVGDCAAPLVRYDGTGWEQFPAPDGGSPIYPPALYTTGRDSTWVANSSSGAWRWDGTSWIEEPATNTAFYATIKAFWAPPSSAPTFAVGGGYSGTEVSTYWRRGTDGRWNGPTNINVSNGLSLVAIAGPNEQNLYAVGGANTALQVVQWDFRNTAWRPEPLPALPPLEPPQYTRQAQDIWVSADGSDVWVAINSNDVLRKRNGTWSVVRLPFVAPDFQAFQVEGFANGDLWFSGVRYYSGNENAAVAYRFRRLASP